MIDIHVPQSVEHLPNVNVESRLRSELAIFSFDTGRYAEGLELAGVPSMLIERLTVDFTRSSDYGTAAYYTDESHTVDVRPGKLANVGLSFPWTNQFPTVQRDVNFELAKNTQRIADTVLKDPTLMALNAETKVNLRVLSLTGTTLVGLLAGGVIAAKNGDPVLLGDAMGAAAGAAVTLVSVFGIEMSKDASNKRKAWHENYEALEVRENNFANRPEVFKIFNDIVKIKFVN